MQGRGQGPTCIGRCGGDGRHRPQPIECNPVVPTRLVKVAEHLLDVAQADHRAGRLQLQSPIPLAFLEEGLIERQRRSSKSRRTPSICGTSTSSTDPTSLSICSTAERAS